MFRTGIPKLDEYLGGGIPPGKTLLYYVFPGVEGDVFGMQTLYCNLKDGKRGMYVVSSSPPEIAREKFRELGWSLDEVEENLSVIDAYSALVGMDSKEKYVVEDPQSVDSISKTVSQALKENEGSLIVFDSLSSLMDLCGEENVLGFCEDLGKQLIVYDGAGVYSFTAWPYPEDVLRRVKEEMFNAVINIGGLVEKIVFGQYYEISKIDWGVPRESKLLFRISKPGGVRVYIPKILVTGPFHAGKTTFIHALSTRAVSVDRLGTTIALDHGHVDHKGISADIFGTPGQERFDPLLELLGGEAMGVILVIDSTQPKTFPRAREMLEKTKTHGLPVVVAANKQDLKDALPPEEIRKQMKLPKEIPIVPVVATKRIGVIDVFERLIEEITK